MPRRSFIDRLIGRRRDDGENIPPSDDPPRFPPVPLWQPSFAQPLDRIIDRLSYYSDGKRDFVVFYHGTCVILEADTDDDAAETFALNALDQVLNAHPDMHPSPMDDGNVLVRYNTPAVSIVLADVATAHWQEVESRHLDGLTHSEVLMTPLGPNKFDDFGKQALLGRAYMFMDAQSPKISQIFRRS